MRLWFAAILFLIISLAFAKGGGGGGHASGGHASSGHSSSGHVSEAHSTPHVAPAPARATRPYIAPYIPHPVYSCTEERKKQNNC